MPSALRRRTDLERAAIDGRADAWQRPPSATQLRALRTLARACDRKSARGFHRTVAGWHALGDSVNSFSSRTMDALKQRGLAKRRRRAIVITTAGRRAV